MCIYTKREMKVWNLCGVLLHCYYVQIMNFSATVKLRRVNSVLRGTVKEVFVPYSWKIGFGPEV